MLNCRRIIHPPSIAAALLALTGVIHPVSAQSGGQVTSAGQPAQLDIRVAGEHSVRVTLKPVSYKGQLPFTPSLAERSYPAPVLSVRSLSAPVKRQVGALSVEVRANPLTVAVTNAAGELVQELVFRGNGDLQFKLTNEAVLGMGEGGPKPARGVEWRNLPIEFDRRGRFHEMVPRWQSDAYGSRNPVAMLVGTGGWGMFVATPWGEIDLRHTDYGVFTPRDPATLNQVAQSQRVQHDNRGKGIPPLSSMVRGLYDVFVFDAHDPAKMMKDISVITGPAVMPPRWALGYMQSHRTLIDETKMVALVDTFRTKQIPVDAVIYLGTGFVKRGWNLEQPSFEFNPEVFQRSGAEVISDLHDLNVKVVMHMVPDDRDKLPTLRGTIPAKPGETMDPSHIWNNWQKHVGLVDAGVDAFWPDEGDWFNLFERMNRHQMYYQGPLATTPNVRPWSLHRNGHLGVAKWGGWVWSGDTQATWKTLEGQIAVGINHSLSLSPFWGSDIGGFYPTEEKTGELFVRWFQFSAFTPSFRSHTRTWHLGLPWGWGLSDMGLREGNGSIRQSEMKNMAIEPVAKAYDELRYQLLPYNYTLAWQARDTGMPMMRAMWLEYPKDDRARGLGTQYMWGRDMLIAPVYEMNAASRDVYLPAGEWYDWWTNEKESGGRTITRLINIATMPIYVRAGAIIPFDPIRQYTEQKVTEPTTLKVYQGANGEFTLYDDDGISQDYLQAKATWTRMRWDDQAKTLTLEPGAPEGAQNQASSRTFTVELLPEGTTRSVNYTGQRVSVKF